MDNLALLYFYWLFWEEAYLLSGILAPLQIMISVWEDLRLYNRHQAILQEKGRVHEKKGSCGQFVKKNKQITGMLSIV